MKTSKGNLDAVAIKDLLLAMALASGGFILLNLTFIFYALLVTGTSFLFPKDFPAIHHWFPPLQHGFFMVVIGGISWLVFRSRMPVFFKATFSTVPMAVALVTLGIFLFRWPLAAYFSGAVVVAAVIFYLYRTKQDWLYFYAAILTGLALAAVVIFGVDI